MTLWLPERIRHVLGHLVMTGGAQAGIQIIGFITGLVVVRTLPVNEYAFYTLATAALGTMTVLADCGISQALLSSGGKVWQNSTALGGIVNGAMRLRRPFAAVAGTVASLVLFVLLRQQGATLLQAVLVTAAIIPLFLSSIAGQIYEVVPRLHQRLAPLQGVQLAGALLRLVAVVAVTVAHPVAWLTSAAAGLAQLWTSWRMRRLAQSLAQLQAPCDPEARVAMLAMLRRTAPSAIYYAFAGQLSVWLISIFGTTEGVAQVGALGRLAMVFNILSTAFALILVPRFARMQTAGLVVARYWWVQGAMFLLFALAVAVVARYPGAALAVLGGDYRLLSTEVVLVAASGAMSLLSGCAYSLAAARGIVVAPWAVIATAILLQIGLGITLPIATVAGVLWMGLITNTVFWLMHTVNFTRLAAK